ncbi:hypothetical protein KIH41_17995 [Litoribacter ruber]|uniref:hypothetical protein n=1 Tax=Litoribacter ruber TaxID=702568 RepID=UPI001BD9E6BD|nr:hypothetical protein [Litoribacter ruber]MBT0813180.1 hypothetical protein [Litoribacter ruber]
MAILSILFLVVNGAWFYKMGVMVDADTERFVLYVSELKERGFFYKPHDFWYIGYVGFLLLVGMLSPKLEAVVLVQYAISYLALISLYDSSLRLFNNRFIALITGACFLGFLMLPFWNLYLYAESLYISLTCLSMWFLIAMRNNRKGAESSEKKLFSSVALFVLGSMIIGWTVLTRPTGVGMLGAVGAVSAYGVWKAERYRKLKIGLLTFGVLGFILLLNQMLSTFGFVEDYQKGEVVYNIYKMAHMDYAKSLIIQAPENLYLPNSEDPALWQFVSLILFNPLYSIQLFGTKLFYFLLYIRPYYSALHNLTALAFLIPVYGLAIYGAARLKGYPAVFFWTYLTICTLSTTLLTIDWNSRFLMPMLPMVFLAAGGGVKGLISHRVFDRPAFLRHFA